MNFDHWKEAEALVFSPPRPSLSRSEGRHPPAGNAGRPVSVPRVSSGCVADPDDDEPARRSQARKRLKAAMQEALAQTHLNEDTH